MRRHADELIGAPVDSPSDKAAAARSRLQWTQSNWRSPVDSEDALSGDPSRAALASFAAGSVQAALLLPMNTLQTRMQNDGHTARVALQGMFRSGVASGVRQGYRALVPTITMLGARQGLKFGSGAAFKQQLPIHWPEPVRDAAAGSLAAISATTLLFPLDTLKTRWQLNLPSPSLVQVYQGFQPAVAYSAFGMALWVVSRNSLERTIPTPEQRGARYWKHFICGGLAGIIVQLPTFPFDTLKKRLQSSETPRSMVGEARMLLEKGGPARLYRGFTIKCAFVALNGALFNAIFVGITRALAQLPRPAEGGAKPWS